MERCRALLHLVDGTADDVAADYRTVRGELDAYDAGLPDKLELVCLNKCDALTDDLIAERKAELAAECGQTVHVISGVAGKGLPELLAELASAIGPAAAKDDAEEARETAGTAASGAGGWQP